MNNAGVGPIAQTLAGLSLRHSDDLFDALVEGAFELILIVNHDGLVHYANQSMERMLGHRPSLLVGSNIVSLIHPDDAAHASGMLEVFRMALPDQDLSPRMMETRFGHKDGSWPVLESVFQALDTAAVTGIVIQSRDVTARMRSQALLAGENRVLEMIGMDAPLKEVLVELVRFIEAHSNGAHCGILLLDHEGLPLPHWVAPGMPQDYLRALGAMDLGSRLDACDLKAGHTAVFVQSELQSDTRWADYRDLALRHGFTESWAAPMLSVNGTLLGVLSMHRRTAQKPSAAELKLATDGARIAGIAIDRKQVEARFNHMAYHDPLTGLPNRVLLQDRMTQAIIHAERIKQAGAVLFIDLDQFKRVNDTLGHAVGDRLLQEVARRLLNCMRKEDSLGRLGGDEFVLTLMAPADGRSAAQVAQKIRDALQVPVMVEGREVRMSCSIGISMYPENGTSADVLIRNADTAMYRAKTKGRGDFQYFTPDLNTQVQNRNSMANQLREALVRGEFKLHYQCQVHIPGDSIFAVEALLRWCHPQLGAVSPDEFIPIAEETGLILQIGYWALREGCSQLKRWHDAGHSQLCISFNLSQRQLLQPDIASVLAGILDATGLPASALTLEIAEEMLTFPIEEKLAALTQLSRAGIGLSLDNFGTGYSSLADLQRLSLSALKIDQSFVHGIGRDSNDTALASAIIAMGRELHLNVIAAGVETGLQASFLKENGCHGGQGYFYGKPITAAAMTQRLRLPAS